MPDAADLARQAQLQTWALQIALAQRYRPAGWLTEQVVQRIELPSFIDHYRDTLMYWLVDTVAEAQQRDCLVQLANTEELETMGLTTYVVVGRTHGATQRALDLLDQRFRAIGIPTRVVHDFTGDSLSYCLLDSRQHDPDQVVARMEAPLLRHEGKVWRKK